MPRQFSPDQKAAALEILASNGGDINQAHFQTGIPQRTLYRWRNDLWQTWRRQAPPPPSPKPLPEFRDDLDALAYLRHKIMVELLNLANSYSDSAAYTTPAQRINFLSQLTDRLMKLDEHLQPYKKPDPKEYHIVEVGDPGLYIRTEQGYYGPYTPSELRRDWKAHFGPAARLEICWGDASFSLVPEQGEALELLLRSTDFNAEDRLFLDNGYAEDRAYHWG